MEMCAYVVQMRRVASIHPSLCLTQDLQALCLVPGCAGEKV